MTKYTEFISVGENYCSDFNEEISELLKDGWTIINSGRNEVACSESLYRTIFWAHLVR